MAGKLSGELALLDDLLVYTISTLAKTRTLKELHAIHFVAWSFLGGVQSEVLPLQMGAQADLISDLPSGLRSSVMTILSEGNKALQIRWARRKNQPGVSRIKRLCTCGAGCEPTCCVVCVLEQYCKPETTPVPVSHLCWGRGNKLEDSWME